MAKKKRPDRPAKLPQFSANPFSSLKGVVAATAPPAAKPPATEVLQVPHDNDDATLFLKAMDDVKKLDNARQNAGKDTVSPRRRHVSSAEMTAGTSILTPDSASTELFLQEIGRLKLEVKFNESLPDEDELKPLSGNRLKQLKRGIISVDYQLDLHGLTRDEALAELPRFLRTARMRGQTAVLVITGKGYNSDAEPVLQQAVAAWLRDAGRELVVEFTPAPREMGGSGAFVVFLRSLPKPISAPR